MKIEHGTNEYAHSFGLEEVPMVETEKAPGKRILAWLALSRLPFHTVGKNLPRSGTKFSESLAPSSSPPEHL